MTTSSTLEELAQQALEGDRDALDSLVRALQGDLYGLSLRMLWNREDAEDATQEILVRMAQASTTTTSLPVDLLSSMNWCAATISSNPNVRCRFGR